MFAGLRNIRLRLKFALIFLILLVLIVDLGALSYTSVTDIRADTERISDVLIPRLIQTGSIRDNLNDAIQAATDYVETGNPASKKDYEEKLNQALVAQIELFYLSQSSADFEFTTSFQTYINDINESLERLISLYEAGAAAEDVDQQLTVVSKQRAEFGTFLEEEIELKIQEEAQSERERTDQRVQTTIINIAIVGIISIIVFLMIFFFLRQSITKPIGQLTEVAEDIGKGNFRAVEIDSKDELGLFASTFNTMTTRIKATQEALVVELEKTKKLDKQKTEFLSIAAHQLRTPMSGIKWVVSMAVEGDLGELPEDAKTQLAKGLDNINRMIVLINSLLDVTKIETQEGKYQFIAGDLQTTIQEVVSSLEPNMEEAGVKVVMEEPAEALPLVQIDKEKIKMAFRNVIDNAIRYSPKGQEVAIRFRVAGDMVEVDVSDQGYGIPQKEQERIFTKFYRGTNIQTKQPDGSGLGLYVVGQILRSHEGSVSFESEENTGTTFTFALPTATPQLIEQTQQVEAAGGAETEVVDAGSEGALAA